MNGFVLLRTISVIVFMVCSLALLFWLLGITAGFQRSILQIDIVTLVFFVFAWIPIFVWTIITFIFLRGGSNAAVPIVFLQCIFVLCLFIFHLRVIRDITSIEADMLFYAKGWIIENVTEGIVQISDDKKFEYRLDLINIFQRNSRARLFVRNLETKEEKNIRLPMDTRRIYGFTQSRYNPWIRMESTDIPYHYIVRTVGGFDQQLNAETYKIDMRARTAILYSGGWSTTVVRGDILQIADDGRLEYRFEFIDLYTKYATASLFVRCLETGAEKNISLPNPSSYISGVMIFRESHRWSVLESTDASNQYILTTLDGVTIIGDVTFKIDMEEKVATMLTRRDLLRASRIHNYQTRLEFINLNQQNSRARLYVNCLDTNIDKYIYIPLDTDKINSFVDTSATGFFRFDVESNHYILSIAEIRDDIPSHLQFRMEFKIDVLNQTAILIE